MQLPLFTFEELYPDCDIKEYRNTVEFSFPITVPINNDKKNGSIDLFTDSQSPLGIILKLYSHNIKSKKERVLSYTNWPQNLFCDIYKFIITKVEVLDTTKLTDSVKEYDVKLVVKGNKPRGFYIPDIIYDTAVNLQTNGMLYVYNTYRRTEDGSIDNTFDNKQILNISGFITGSIRKNKQ